MQYFKIQYLLLDLVIAFIVFYIISYIFALENKNVYNRILTTSDNFYIRDSLKKDVNKKETSKIEEILNTKEILKKQINDLTEKPKEELYQYIKITGSCGPYYNGTCLNIRSTPTTSGQVIYRPRNGVVLKVKDKIDVDGVEWYQITFDEWLLYPDRLTTKAYIKADTVVPFFDIGIVTHATTSRQKIVINIKQQTLSAYNGKELFLSSKVSTGLRGTPTATGTFTIFRKTPTRYMQGPVPDVGGGYYDLPGVPWNMYFNADGSAIHGAYWHESFGRPYSHGCVNLPPATAKKLYKWAKVGAIVTIVD